ncbi:MAG: CbtA family protein [Rhodospirillaceae bacterium]|nr:CbtA family protein [Rhodospirillaceae bacterium]
MLKRIFTLALVAGVVAGLFASLAQSQRLVPMLMQAERYEMGTLSMHDHGGGEMHDHGATPHAGVERTALTVLANIIIASGFGLLLVAGFALRGGTMDWRLGALWGLAGYAAFSLAPAVGLPPEVPGTMRADLFDRQAWWLLTATATAGGLALIAFAHRVPIRAVGVALLALPHIYGAPHPVESGGVVPAELASDFAFGALVIAGLFWLLLGSAAGYLYGRMGDGDRG